MDIRYATNPREFELLSPADLRARFVLERLFVPGEVSLTLSHHDRLVIGGVVPGGAELALVAPDELRCDQFCDRREIAVVCLEGEGTVRCGSSENQLRAEDILYIGKGSRDIVFSGDDAVFYLVSAPAHQELPTVLVRKTDAQKSDIGDAAHASARTIRKYVHDQGVPSCELAVGITTLHDGSVWNTMPCHTHDRRTEIYLYFGLPEDERVMHLCGRPSATRSLVLANRQAVISRSWSVHTGAGTASYRFVWSTGGENLAYTDMDMVATRDLR